MALPRTPYTYTHPADPDREDDGLFGPGVGDLARDEQPDHVGGRGPRAIPAGAASAGDPRHAAERRRYHHAGGRVGQAEADQDVYRDPHVWHDRRGRTSRTPGAHDPRGAHLHRPRRHAVPGGRPRVAALGALRRGRLGRRHRPAQRAAVLRRGPGCLRRRAAHERRTHRRGPCGRARVHGRTRRLLRADPAGAVRVRRGEAVGAADLSSAGARRELRAEAGAATGRRPGVLHPAALGAADVRPTERPGQRPGRDRRAADGPGGVRPGTIVPRGRARDTPRRNRRRFPAARRRRGLRPGRGGC
jgi:hypothetical protein